MGCLFADYYSIFPKKTPDPCRLIFIYVLFFTKRIADRPSFLPEQILYSYKILSAYPVVIGSRIFLC